MFAALLSIEMNEPFFPLKFNAAFLRISDQVRELLDDVAAAKQSQDSGLAPQTLESLALQVSVLFCFIHESSASE
jgi:hypothetical protein